MPSQYRWSIFTDAVLTACCTFSYKGWHIFAGKQDGTAYKGEELTSSICQPLSSCLWPRVPPPPRKVSSWKWSTLLQRQTRLAVSH